MDMRFLPYFREVARQGSFSAAAATLRVSQPAVSKMIGALESSLGVTLFKRVRHGAVLTEEGKLLYARCEKIGAELSGIDEDFRRAKNECVGTVDFGASDNICNYLLPPILAGFCAKNPKIKLRLMSGTSGLISDELSRGRLDFGLFYHLPRHRDLESLILGKVLFSVVIRAGHKRSKHWQELPYIGSRGTDYGRPYAALKLLRSIQVTPTLIHEVNNQETQKRLVLAGLGYSVLPRFMISDEIRSGELVEISSPNALAIPLHCARKKRERLPLGSGVLLTWIQDRISTEAFR